MQIFNAIPLTGFLFILVFLIIRIGSLKRKGIVVSKGSEKSKKSSTLLLYPVFAIILLVWLFEIIQPFFQLSFSVLPEVLTRQLSESVLLKFTGVILIFLSLVLWTITLLHFKNSLRFGLDENNQDELITTGIFSLTRNPFFLSLDLYFVGVALILSSLFFIGFAVLAIISIHFFILKEERFLQKIYGDEYEKYEEKVRRYF